MSIESGSCQASKSPKIYIALHNSEGPILYQTLAYAQ